VDPTSICPNKKRGLEHRNRGSYVSTGGRHLQAQERGLRNNQPYPHLGVNGLLCYRPVNRINFCCLGHTVMGLYCSNPRNCTML
jgi:hypothetical protein